MFEYKMAIYLSIFQRFFNELCDKPDKLVYSTSIVMSTILKILACLRFVLVYMKNLKIALPRSRPRVRAPSIALLEHLKGSKP